MLADSAHPSDPVVDVTTSGRAAKLRRPFQMVTTAKVGPYVGLVTILAAVIVYSALTQEAFLTETNIVNTLRNSAIPLVLAAGMTLVVITAGVDLSIGSILALCTVFYGQMAVSQSLPGVVALLLTLVLGALLGLFNGYLIGKIRMSFFVVTLGTLSLYRGLAQLWRNQSFDMFDYQLPRTLGNDTIFGDRLPIGFMLAIGVCTVVFLASKHTRFGRSVYAVGGNREAAELSGIRAGWIVALVYSFSGLCAALGAVMLIGRTTIAVSTSGQGIELGVVAAVLLGGAALSGGQGSIWGTVLAVIFLEVLSNALDLAAVSGFWQQIVTGVILIAAVYLDSLRSRRAGS